MSATQLKMGVRAWHHELVEFMIANPRANLQETALYFDASVSWISIVKNSDAFKELWNKRRNEHFSTVSAGISERVTALAEVTVDALTTRMEKEIKADTATIDQLKEVGDMALKALGFGAKHSPGIQLNQQNNNTTIFVDKSTLERAREARRAIQSNETPKLIEGEKENTEDIIASDSEIYRG